MTNQYWVEADKAVKDHSRVIGYSVWKATDESGRYGERIKQWRIGGPRTSDIALFLANGMRDNLNMGIKK